MADETLVDYLVAAFEHLKMQRDAISLLLNEVSAVRESLLEKHPELTSVLDRHRTALAASNALIASQALARYDEIIQKLKDFQAEWDIPSSERPN